MNVHGRGRARVSVVVPIHNSEPYLQDAINSLLRQTEPFHEIIAVNDGSTDGSRDLLRTYERNALVRVIDQENRGPGPARNHGARHATGNWIYFFDSDDLANPRLVETISDKCAETAKKLDAILFSGRPFADASVHPSILKRVPAYKRPHLGCFESFYDATIALDAHAASYVSPCLYVISSELLRAKPIQFPGNFHEDDCFYLHLLAYARNTLVLSDVLFERRIRAGSVTTSPKNEKHVRGYLRASSTARDYSKQQKERAKRLYFERRAVEYYLQAVVVSEHVEGPNPCKSLISRLLGVPTWNLTLEQYAFLLSAGRQRHRPE